MRCRSLLSLLCLVASAAWSAPNLLQNPGGEDGPAGWGGNVERLADAAAAHTGQAGFRGTVDKKDDHRRLTQTVRLTAEVPYQFSLWARSDERCQLVLWMQKGQQRFSPGRWEQTAKPWKRYQTVLSVPEDGDWEFQIIAPSSLGKGVPGTIFVDDIALLAMAAGRPTKLSADDVIADQVDVGSGGGKLWAAWEEYAPDRDRLRVAALDPGNPTKVLKDWAIDFGAKSFALWPRLVVGEQAAWLVVAAEVKGQWDTYAVPLGADGPGQPVQVTRDGAGNMQVQGALDGTTLWLAWSANRDGARRIIASSVTGGQVAAPTVVSDAGAYRPTVAVGGGRVYVVCDRYHEGDRDLYLNVLDDGRWTGPRRLTTSNRFDFMPSAVWWRGGLWLTWLSGELKGYRLNSLDLAQVAVAQVTDQGLQAPVGLAKGLGARHPSHPVLAVDAADRLWLAFRQARDPQGRQNWDTTVGCYNGQQWGEWQQSNGVAGRAHEPGLTAVADQMLVAGEADNVGSRWADNKAAEDMWSRVEALALPTSDQAPAAEVKTVPYEDASNPEFTIAAERQRMGAERGAWSFEYQGQTLNAKFGDFHEHSAISICARGSDQPPEEDYISMRENSHLDFGALTDHGYNIAAPIWRYSSKITRVMHDPGRFVTFVAEEWTSNNEKTTKPPGFYGHHNLIFADPYFPQWYNSKDERYYTPKQVWDVLDGQNFIMIPHQLADSGTNVPVDWNYTDEVKQPVAEIFQARESYEADDAPRRTKNGYPGYFLQDVWARGIKIGVIAAPDHGGGKGNAGVLIDEFTRESVLDACRARHTWGSTAAKIAMGVTVDGHLMGDIVKQPKVGTVKVHVAVSAAGPIAAIRIIRNNRMIHTSTEAGPDVTFDFLDNAPLTENSYYYVRVERADGELAWSSPVWLDREA